MSNLNVVFNGVLLGLLPAIVYANNESVVRNWKVVSRKPFRKLAKFISEVKSLPPATQDLELNTKRDLAIQAEHINMGLLMSINQVIFAR